MFVAWFGVIASCAIQYPMVWVAFWNHMQDMRLHVHPVHRRSVALPLWAGWVAVIFCYRRTIYRRAPPDLSALLLHAEVFTFVVLAMTGECGCSPHLCCRP